MVKFREFDSSTPDPSERAFPPGTVNGRLLEAVLRHRHFILRVENGVIRDLLVPLKDAQQEILAQLARIAASDDAMTDFALLRVSRLREMNRRIEAALQFSLRDVLTRSARNFADFAEREVEIQAAFLRRHIPKGISLDLIGPDARRLEAMISEPLGGARWANRIRQNYGELSLRMQRSLGTSVALGEGIGPAVTRLRKITTKVGTNRLATLARSEIQRVANRTALDTYQRNGDVIKGVQVLETLDLRTCLVCASRDGDVHPLNVSPHRLPPYHAGCRGYTVPVVRSFEEMGLEPRDFPPSTRASMDGQVSDALDYEEWFGVQSPNFQREMLGPTRFTRFQSGELQITDFVRDNRILRIDELPTMSLSGN